MQQSQRGEADQIFYLYTEQLGKVVALARGSKKISSKLNNQLQFFAVIDLTIARGKNFDHIIGAQLAENFSQLKNSYASIVRASYGLELVNQLTQPGHPDPEIFFLLFNYLKLFDASKGSGPKSWPLIQQRFVTKLLTLLGYQPPPKIAADLGQLKDFLKNYLNQELKSEVLLRI